MVGMRSSVAIVGDRFFLRPLIFVALVLSSTQVQAQQPRQLVLRHVRPAVSSGRAISVGAMPQRQQLNLSILLPPRNATELADLLVRLYDPSSPVYHRFLTVAQFTEQFSPSAEDYKAAVNFARANGFTVTGTPTNRLLVPIRGTVEQIEKTFHIRMQLYQHPTENRIFFSPDQEPSLDLNVPVAHIAGLNNFSVPHSMAISAPVTTGDTAEAGTGSGPGGSYLGSDMRAAYYGGTALTGSGQAVGLAEFDGYNLSDVNSVFSNVGQSYSVRINNVLLDGASGSPCQFQTHCSDAEQVLDIAQAIGMAPGLDQVRVYIGNLDTDILNAMASENVAKQLSISWWWSPDDPSIDDVFFEEFAAQGQSIFVASGDSGPFDPLSDNYYPAEDAYITAVGGTVLFTNGAGGSWNEEWPWGQGAGSEGSGGGISPDGIPIPSWQTGVANSSNQASTTLRNVPDVAMEANTDNYNCDMGTCAGTWGGTSFAAPRWAAYLALINQQALAAGNPTVGFINPGIYAIGEGSNYNSDFHDIWVYPAVAGYDLVTGWGSPTGQKLIDAVAPAPSGSFHLLASPSSLSINPNSSGTTTITVNGQAGFSGSVNFAVTSELPNGVTAEFDQNPTAGSSVLTLAASSSAIRGSYLVTVTGTSGALSATVDIAVEVNVPGFTILPSPGPLQIFPGISGSIFITVTNYSGFAGSVDLAVTSPLPSGVTAYWTSGPSNGVSILTLSASNSTVPVRTVLTITGICGALTATTTIPLVIGAPTFAIVLSPVPYYIAQGGSAITTATVAPIGNWSYPVTLEAFQLPPGVTATFNPNQTSSTSQVSLAASSSATLGTFWTNIENSLFPMTVTATPTPTFGVGISPGFLTMTQGETVTSTVTIVELNGFSGSISLQTAELPSGVTATFSVNPTTGTSGLTLTASPSSAVGIFPVSVIGFSGTRGFSGYLELIINPAPAFGLSPSASSVNLAQSSTITSAVTVVPQAGFTGSVNLTTSALPSGISGTFSPNPATRSSVLTLTANGTVPLGNYPVIIAGTSGTRTINTVVSLLVSPAGAPTTTLLSITPNGGTLTTGAPYTLTATVVPATGSTAPSGNVVFTVGSSTQTVTLDSAGVATYTGTAPPTGGSLALSAAYLGTTAFAASISNILNETITLPVSPSFNISGTPVTLSPGAITGNTSTITVTPAGGFTGTVAMTATITSSPTGARHPPTLSFGSTSPVSITDANAHTATLTVSTSAPSSSFVLYTIPRRLSWATTWGMTLACTLLFGVLARQLSWRTKFVMLVLIVFVSGGMLACGTGSGNSDGTGNPGTSAGVYTITVTGISGKSTSTSTVTLTVE